MKTILQILWILWELFFELYCASFSFVNHRGFQCLFTFTQPVILFDLSIFWEIYQRLFAAFKCGFQAYWTGWFASPLWIRFAKFVEEGNLILIVASTLKLFILRGQIWGKSLMLWALKVTADGRDIFMTNAVMKHRDRGFFKANFRTHHALATSNYCQRWGRERSPCVVFAPRVLWRKCRVVRKVPLMWNWFGQ